MNSTLLYQWESKLSQQFSILGRWQVWTLALFSFGVISAKNCCLIEVGKNISGRAEASSMERRLQRWLANGRLDLPRLIDLWVKWILQLWGHAPMLILVDETKLSNHVSVMMVGVAYHACAIPLIWRAYDPSNYPEEGQVKLMMGLLDQLRALLPPSMRVLVLADRGLGTSPEWQRRLSNSGWDYLLPAAASSNR